MSDNLNPGPVSPGGNHPRAVDPMLPSIAPPPMALPLIAPPGMNYPPPLGYSGPFAHPSSAQQLENQRHANRRSTWGPVLVVACLAIGLLAAALQLTREKLKEEQSRANELNTTTVFVEASMENLGKLMADPHTMLVGLTGPAGSAVHHGSLAWNPSQNSGALFCDTLPAFDSAKPYEIWGAGSGGAMSRLAEILARPGTGIYPFKATSVDAAVVSFEITTGPRSPAQTPVLVGTIASKNAMGG